MDDDVSTRDALARLLRAHGINSQSYASARAFLQALHADRIDCLIVDVNMPDTTGLELQSELLDRDVRIPIIVITACDDDVIARKARSLGAAAFLLKPVARDGLEAAIRSTRRRS